MSIKSQWSECVSEKEGGTAQAMTDQQDGEVGEVVAQTDVPALHGAVVDAALRGPAASRRQGEVPVHAARPLLAGHLATALQSCRTGGQGGSMATASDPRPELRPRQEHKKNV